MAASGITPHACACSHCARPISAPSGQTIELLDMFWALNGATDTPVRESQRQIPEVTRLLPASDVVPATSRPLATTTVILAPQHLGQECCERERADPDEPGQPGRPGPVGCLHRTPTVHDAAVLAVPGIRAGAPEPHAEGTREGRLDGARIGARVRGRIASPHLPGA